MLRNAEEMTVNADKKKLIGKLEANKVTHEKEYEKAIKGWRVKSAQALRERADKIEAGEKVDTDFPNLPKPRNHTVDYENALQMLEMHVDPQIKLGFQVYRQFVQDDWDWKHTFSVTNSGY